MNLMFWKKETTTGDSEDDSQEEPGDKPVSRKSLGRESRHQEISEDTHGETVEVSPSQPKQRLIIGAAIGVLILAAIGLTAWKIFLPSSKQTTATADTPTSIQAIPLPEKKLIKAPPIEFLKLRKAQSKDHQADIEALKKKNNELQEQIDVLRIEPTEVENQQGLRRQAEIEILKKNNDELQTKIEMLKAELPQIEKAQAEQHQADIDAITKKNNELRAQIEVLKKKQQQDPSASPAGQAAGKAQPRSAGGEMAIGSKNPKATAMTLKEAIEAMNANSGNPPAKAAK